jgi:hypothetical protein
LCEWRRGELFATYPSVRKSVNAREKNCTSLGAKSKSSQNVRGISNVVSVMLVKTGIQDCPIERDPVSPE